MELLKTILFCALVLVVGGVPLLYLFGRLVLRSANTPTRAEERESEYQTRQQAEVEARVNDIYYQMGRRYDVTHEIKQKTERETR